MITSHTLRDLPLSAASGLVIIGHTCYVVADDALHLGVFRLDDPAFAHSIRLRDGQLPAGNSPAEQKARKKQKPDFEALVQLPPQADCPHGALLALGSGSNANRQQGVLVPLDAHGNATHNVTPVDLAALYESLDIDDCNIEGAVVCGEQLVLLQRGNQKHEKSALVLIPVGALLAAPLLAAPLLSKPTVVSVTLPHIGDVPFGFTDGLCLPNGNILFAAVAEATDDSYNDGACLGAAIGEITLQGDLIRYERLPETHKIEGIALSADGKNLYAVTDADDPAVPAVLLLLEEWQR